MTSKVQLEEQNHDDIVDDNVPNLHLNTQQIIRL